MTIVVIGFMPRLPWHSLRHSYASMLATDLELPATTLARLTGHADAGFTLRVYAMDRRDETTVVEDVLARAAGAGIGSYRRPRSSQPFSQPWASAGGGSGRSDECRLAQPCALGGLGRPRSAGAECLPCRGRGFESLHPLR